MSEDFYEGCRKLDYYTNYNDPRPKAQEAKAKEEPHIYERKGGMIKIYNGHIGTYAWEKEDDT